MSQILAATEWPDFLTVGEIADLLRVSKMTVYRLVHSGELESIKVGRSFRVASSSLRSYMAAVGYTEPAQAPAA
jgi:excisionase family DNA binding protein